MGCHHCDKYVEAFRSRRQIIEIVDGTVVPTIRNRAPIHKQAITLPDEQEYELSRRSFTNQISVFTTTILQPDAQKLVIVLSQRHGLITVEPHDGLYQKHQCLTAAWIHHVNPGQQFNVLIETFTNNPVKLNSRKVVATADDHPGVITESNKTDAEMHSTTEFVTKYRNLDENLRDIDKVNQHLTDARIATLGF